MIRTRLRTARRLGVPAALLTILAVAVIAYSPSLDGGFLFDDKSSIELNPRVQGGSAYVARWSAPYALAQRPVTDLTFALDAARSGFRPRAFHETSLLLHLLATLLVFVLTRAVFRRAGAPDQARWAAVAVSALFALHPIQSQAVAYPSQRAELLSSLLTVAALLLLLLADGVARVARAIGLGAAAFGTFALAAGSKMVALAVPALFLFAVAALPARRGESVDSSGAPAPSRWLRRAGLLAPLVALSAFQVTVFLRSVSGSADAGFSVPGLSPWRYLLTEARVIPLYVRLIAWPAGQSLDHEIVPSAGLADPWTTVLGGFFLLLVVGAATWGLLWTLGRGREAPNAPAVRIASFGAIWFLTLLAPTSSIVPLADVVAEHRVYLASWGLLAGAVALAGLAIQRVPGRVRAAVVAGAVIVPALALAAALQARATLWGDPLALWRDASEKSPGRARPQLGIADECFERGNLDGAIAGYERALAIEPGFAREVVLQRIASAYLQKGRPAEARAILSRIPSPEPETVVLQAIASVDLGQLARAAASGGSPWAARWAAIEARQAGCPGAGASPR